MPVAGSAQRIFSSVGIEEMAFVSFNEQMVGSFRHSDSTPF
jgi:hypothetical protein